MKLTIEDFLRRRKEARPSYVFDLRPLEAFQEGKLLGSHNLPFEFFEGNLHRLPFSGDILLYDGGEGLVNQAAAILEDNGFSDFFFAEEGYEVLVKALETSPHAIKLVVGPEDDKPTKLEVIQNLLDMEINPQVAAHGGNFRLVDIKDNSVFVELGGGCQGCGMVDVTLRQGVETRMREAFPAMVDLIDITDHDEGETPYYEANA